MLGPADGWKWKEKGDLSLARSLLSSFWTREGNSPILLPFFSEVGVGEGGGGAVEDDSLDGKAKRSLLFNQLCVAVIACTHWHCLPKRENTRAIPRGRRFVRKTTQARATGRGSPTLDFLWTLFLLTRRCLLSSPSQFQGPTTRMTAQTLMIPLRIEGIVAHLSPVPSSLSPSPLSLGGNCDGLAGSLQT